MKTKKKDKSNWKKWFAWYPVFVELESTTVWLETIWRKDKHPDWEGYWFDYSIKNPNI